MKKQKHKIDQVVQTKNAETFLALSATSGTAITVLKDTTPVPKDEDKSQKYVSWFSETNAYPQELIAKVEKDPEIYPFIERYVELLYSGGIAYGYWQTDNKGKRTFIRMQDKRIDAWMEESNISLYFQEAGIDLKFFSNGWAELIADVKDKMLFISVQDASFCRFGKQNSKGIKDKTFVSGEWEKNPTKDAIKIYDTINPYFRPLAQAQSLKTDVIYFPMINPGLPGAVYYQKPSWKGLIDGSVIELSQLIIEFKTQYLKRGMTLKYHCEVDEKYFLAKYGNEWTDAKPKDRKEIMQKEADWFTESMTGIDKTGKTLLTIMRTDARLEQYSTWKITPLKTESVSDEYTNDMNQNTLIKLRAIGLDPALLGSVSGDKGNISGSGSSARTALNIHSIMNKRLQDIILSPVNTVVKYWNGFDKVHPDLKFISESFFLSTLDQVNPENRL